MTPDADPDSFLPNKHSNDANFLRHLQPVSLRVGEGEAARWYPSLVLDFEEGKEVVVGVPMEGGYETRVEPGSVVSVPTRAPTASASSPRRCCAATPRPSPALASPGPRTCSGCSGARRCGWR